MKPRSMTSLLPFFSAAVLIINITSTFTPAMAAEEFKVGGAEGWRLPSANETEMYTNWAASKRFHIGDSLRFEYKNDSVMVVDKWGYYHCNSSHPDSVFNDGNTVINLDRPGPIYFVSADPEHCKIGQRLVVEVISLHSRSPPEPFMDASPAPSPFSGAGSFPVGTKLVSLYVVLAAVSISIV